jgi:hypothetical protein
MAQRRPETGAPCGLKRNLRDPSRPKLSDVGRWELCLASQQWRDKEPYDSSSLRVADPLIGTVIA